MKITKHIIAKRNRDLMLRLIPSKSDPVIGMATDPNDLAFDCTLKQNGIEEKPTEVEKFYQWLKDMGNVHIAKQEQLVEAFHKIANH